MYIRSAPVVCVCIFNLVHFYCCRRIGLFAYFSKCVSVLSCVYICLRLHFASIIIWVCICDSIPVSISANCLLQKQSISRHVSSVSPPPFTQAQSRSVWPGWLSG